MTEQNTGSESASKLHAPQLFCLFINYAKRWFTAVIQSVPTNKFGRSLQENSASLQLIFSFPERTRKLYYLAGLVVAARLLIPAAHAEAFAVAGRSIEIPAPAGYCKIGDTSGEQQFISSIASTAGPRSQLLAVFVGCEKLVIWRATAPLKLIRPPDWYTVVAARGDDGQIHLEDKMSRANYVRELKDQITHDKSFGSQRLADSETELNQLAKGVHVTLSGVPIAADDDDAVYLAIAGDIVVNDRQPQKFLSIIGMTLIHGVPVRYNIGHLVSEPEQSSSSLVNLKAAITAALIANSTEEGPISVSLVDADFGPFLIYLASKYKTDLVIGPGLPNSRITLRGTYSSFDELLSKMATLEDAEVVTLDGIRIVRNRCTPPPGVRIRMELAPEVVSLNLEKVDLEDVIEVLRQVNVENSIITAPDTNSDPFTWMSIRVKGAHIADILSAIDIAFASIATNTEGKIYREDRPSMPDCSFDRRLPAEKPLTNEWLNRTKGPCLDPLYAYPNQDRKCGQLEYFAISEFLPRGTIFTGGHHEAVLEVSGMTLLAPIGTRIGQHVGIITRITDSEILIKQLKLGPDNLFRSDAVDLAIPQPP